LKQGGKMKRIENIVGQWQIPFFKYMIIALVITVLLFLVMKYFHKDIFVGKYVTVFISVIYLLILYKGYIGIFGLKFSDNRLTPNFIPLRDIISVYSMGFQRMLEQIILNIVSFIPWGILLPIMFDKLRKYHILLFSTVIFTVVIEIVQYFIGGSMDIDDVILRSIGASIGYLLFFCSRKWICK